LLEVRQERRLNPEEVERIELDTFDVAFHIIGGGEEGGKQQVRTKEEADHSLPYLLAVALLDGEVTPAQYTPERIARSDVQTLLHKVVVRSDEALSRSFPQEMPARLRIYTQDSRDITVMKRDYEGFFTRPMSWEGVAAKFEQLAAPFAEPALQRAVTDAVSQLERIPLTDLTSLLGKVGKEKHDE
jgi:2-methylcitrate dehydratase